MRTPILLTLLAVAFLIIFNPDMEEFQDFVEAHSERIVQAELGDSAVARALSGAAGGLASRYIDRITERDNYFVFSIYTVDLDGADADAEEWRFLGVAGQFFETERPASLEDD